MASCTIIIEPGFMVMVSQACAMNEAADAARPSTNPLT